MSIHTHAENVVARILGFYVEKIKLNLHNNLKTTIKGAQNRSLELISPFEVTVAGNKLPTPINSDKLHYFLQNYDANERTFLYEGFTEGFRMPFDGQCASVVFQNHKSCRENPKNLKEKILSDLGQGRIAGPFDKPPLPNLVCSPLGLVPKHGTNS